MSGANRALGILLVALVIAGLWQGTVWYGDLPPFILPSPALVAEVLWTQRSQLITHGTITLIEIVAGLVLGTCLGVGAAVLLSATTRLRRLVLPLVIASQAIPVFAIAPLLVIWLGYGMASKIAMACIIIFFPVTIALADGIARLDQGLVDLARVMTGGAAKRGARWRLLVHLYGPAALPALGSGLRIAAAVAPIGAVVGEWVGSAGGLGWLMLHANARAKIDLMFAGLIVLAAIAMILYLAVDALMRWATPWAANSQPATLTESDPR